MELPSAGTGEFVTVVSVQEPSSAPENFVTVLSIGLDRQQLEKESSQNVEDPAHPEEEVEVYRLPGERLGFGLKFDGGNKTSEKVRRLFIQSCAEQSPASRAKCSWGNLGEGDEVLSIDGVSVTQMTRLDCVRRLKESQLVIKLAVRYRGALRPKIVSAERKPAGDLQQNGKTPPELPVSPPPVPPRKLRHSSHAGGAGRGPADGEACSGSKKARGSPKSNGSSDSGSPRSQESYRSAMSSVRSAGYESCNSSPAKAISGKTDSPKNSPKVYASPNSSRLKQNGGGGCLKLDEPAEAQWYLDARSQDGSSTHGSTSDDTGSSLSTVLDRLSSCANSDRISIASSLSSASELQPQQTTLDSPSFLLARLVGSEGRTHVESRGDVERITALVAPSKVLIEEQPAPRAPLSFQDAPLSYGHEPQPGLLLNHLDSSDETQQQRQSPPKPAPRREAKPRKRRPPPPPPPPTAARRQMHQPDAEPSLEENKQEKKADEAREVPTCNKVLEIVEIRKARALSPCKVESDAQDADPEAEEPRPESPERGDSERKSSVEANPERGADERPTMTEQEHVVTTDDSDDADDYYWQSNLDTIGEEGESSHSDNDNIPPERSTHRVNSSMENPQITQTLVEDSVTESAVEPDLKQGEFDLTIHATFSAVYLLRDQEVSSIEISFGI
ncbi:hypothetical protein QAD02_014406 [Eretmocerus hayati]|uniref:Uncharacterized protein n=1 Tax=Eretmocerus hayati TaxID=131215 RepID=A0ACC2P7P7_9HYME|nr:hypothetical protein QAD02_014406 [Eretmocerus hayati]